MHAFLQVVLTDEEPGKAFNNIVYVYVCSNSIPRDRDQACDFPETAA